MLTYCNPNYGNAIASSDQHYLPKPLYKGVPVAAVYATATAQEGVVYHKGEQNRLYMGQVHRAHSGNAHYFAYGAFGYKGNYTVHLDPARAQGRFDGPKEYHGYGLRADGGYAVKLGAMWLRVGGGMAWSREMGAYASFRKQAQQADLIQDLHPKPSTITLLQTMELVWAPGKKHQLGIAAQGGMSTANEGQLTVTGVLFYQYGSVGVQGCYNVPWLSAQRNKPYGLTLYCRLPGLTTGGTAKELK